MVLWTARVCGRSGYERLVDDPPGQKKRPPPRRYAGAAAAAVFILTATSLMTTTTTTIEGHRTAAQVTLFAAGVALKQTGKVLTGHQETALCDCSAGCSIGTPTVAPSAAAATEEWSLYFSNSDDGDSYIWSMTQEEETKPNTTDILLSTSGHLLGLVADANHTWIYYGVSDGGVYRVTKTGSGIEKITAFDGAIGGMDIDEQHVRIYFAGNATDRGVFRVDVECGGYSLLQVLSLDGAWGVAYDQLNTMLYVSTLTGTIYSTSVDDLPDLAGTSLTEIVNGVSRLRGIAVDVSTHIVYYASKDGIHSVNGTLLYEGTEAVDVSVDQSRNLLFYADNEKIYEGDLQGTVKKSTILTLEHVHFLDVVAALPPPTPTPTRVHTHASSVTPVPTTTTRAALPSPLPTTSEPTFCSAIMEECDLCTCGDAPTPVPTAAPMALPTPTTSSLPPKPAPTLGVEWKVSSGCKRAHPSSKWSWPTLVATCLILLHRQRFPGF